MADMKKGEKGRVVAIEGGRFMQEKLDSMGIRPGSEITKTSNSFLQGPVTVQVGTSRIAIGFGMARRVVVRIEKEN